MGNKRWHGLMMAMLVGSSLMAQTKGNIYEKGFNKVDSLIGDGLTESAMKEVNRLYAVAKSAGNDAQMVHALIYRMELVSEKEEDALPKNISGLEKEIKTARPVAKAILQSLEAQLYRNYLQRHRYELYNRTATQAKTSTDPATWSLSDFHETISRLFLASLQPQSLLQKTRLKAWNPVILEGNVRHLRPSLYDLLAQRALDYFVTGERELTRPAYPFEIDQAAAFDPAADFIHRRFSSTDSSSLQWKALLLYQQLIAFHVNDSSADALLDVDLARLQFVHDNAVNDNKETLYWRALNHLVHQYGSTPAASQAKFLLAKWYADQAAGYESGTADTARFGYQHAVTLCRELASLPDSSEGKFHALQLLEEITRPAVSVQLEKVNLPGLPFRALVNFRNVNRVYYRIVALDPQWHVNVQEENDSAFWARVLSLPALRQQEQSLPLAPDYQEHRVEMKIDSLPAGTYLLLASNRADFASPGSSLSATPFYVSAISWLSQDSSYYVLHRDNGRPLARADVQVWYRYYDSRARQYRLRQGEHLLTDKNGHFQLSGGKDPNGYNYQLDIRFGGDRLWMNDFTYRYYYRRNDDAEGRERKSGYLFTDRSIYRPGQTVYFKGLLVSQQPGTLENHLIIGQTTSIYLVDANGQKVDSLERQTSDYGSYHGQFVLPSQGLNGSFRIMDGFTGGSISFNVEEYKRPGFEVTIIKPEQTFRLNDSVTVSGKANAYAGYSISGGNVKYTVTRRTILPLWYRYGNRKIWPPGRGETVAIAHGETTTDANGHFDIHFLALPDRSVDRSSDPSFHYEIEVSLTDIQGETRLASASITVAYQALQLDIDLPLKIPADSVRRIPITARNLNGIPQPSQVTVTIRPLQAPPGVYRSRYWALPDTFLMSEGEYHGYFPYDLYGNENDPNTWATGTVQWQQADSSQLRNAFQLANALAPGWYEIEARATDRFGEPVKTVSRIQLTGIGSRNPIAYGSITADDEKNKPGDLARYSIETNLDSVWAIRNMVRINQDSCDIVKVSGPGNQYQIPISENDRGGITLAMAFVKHNRVYSDYISLAVPFSNKALSISYETFRDKAEPGKMENWSVRIKGENSEAAAAEILTAMYDASLDQFSPHSWSVPPVWNRYPRRMSWEGDYGFRLSSVQVKPPFSHEDKYQVVKTYDELDAPLTYEMYRRDLEGAVPGVVVRGMALPNVAIAKKSEEGELERSMEADKMPLPEESPVDQAPITLRKNFNETAFFFPDLHTDSSGNVEFSFTLPEALTRWKWMMMAHSKSLAFGYRDTSMLTQKALMVQANAPRFLREGDRMDFSAKIVNMTDSEMTGQVELQLIDPSTNQPVDGWFRNFFPNQYFTVAAGQSVPASFTIEIPFLYNRPVIYRLFARSGNTSDGEQAMLPVLSNRMLVTESLPLNMNGRSKRSFAFHKLLASDSSETLQQHALTVEFTSNPAWYAVQALPYLTEFPYECVEQSFNRYYANSLAGLIVNKAPRIREIFEQWKDEDTAALMSNLQKNQELKSVLLEETPWVYAAKTEAGQKRNIARLFDLVRLQRDTKSALDKFVTLQLDNGGFAWFPGGPDDRYMTQYIVSGLGHLRQLGAWPANSEKLEQVLEKALSYLDNRLVDDYNQLIKQKASLAQYHLSELTIQYLYGRSFFADRPVPGTVMKAYTYYRKQALQFWTRQNRYLQGMIALALFRTGEKQGAKKIIASLKQNALHSEELGMYWKEFNTGGYYWNQAPVEAQSLLIEAFSEIEPGRSTIDAMKTWLLRRKQTEHWSSTRATADACYALLLQGGNWIGQTPRVTIQLGESVRLDSEHAQAGTGYIKKTVDSRFIQSSMGNITVSIQDADSSSASGWGAVYWQYFESLDQITPAKTALSLQRKLFVETQTDRGAVLSAIEPGQELHVGDKVVARIEIRSDRDLEYVHLKDMRAASLEPVNVLSRYRWQGGLGYYESTRDASTSFFFSRLPRGTWVFEYPMRVTHTGTYSNGVSTVECMYAPEFAAHSEGVVVDVEK